MSNVLLSNKQSIKKHLFKKMNVKNFLIFILILVFISALVISPAKYIKVCFNGILVWATAILPALFPFMVFTKILTATGYVEKVSRKLSITKKLYRVPGISSYIFLISIISGYPLGAKITADLYEEGLMNRSEAHRICAFTSNSGPMFVIGTVGVGMLISAVAGYIMLASHILGALLNGLLYRKYNPKEIKLPLRSIKINPDEKDILTRSMENSIGSILLVGGFIAIFFVITEILFSLQIFYPITALFSLFGVDPSITNGLIFGFFEITKGCLTIASTTFSVGIKTIICCFIISFGCLSTTFQAFAFLNKFKISKRFFFLQKTTHAILAMLIASILVIIFSV